MAHTVGMQAKSGIGPSPEGLPPPPTLPRSFPGLRVPSWPLLRTDFPVSLPSLIVVPLSASCSGAERLPLLDLS